MQAIKFIFIAFTLLEATLIWTFYEILTSQMFTDDLYYVYITARAFYLLLNLFLIVLIIYVFAYYHLRYVQQESQTFIQALIRELDAYWHYFLALFVANFILNTIMQSGRLINQELLQDTTHDEWLLGLAIFLSSYVYFPLAIYTWKHGVQHFTQPNFKIGVRTFIVIEGFKIILMLFFSTRSDQMSAAYQPVEQYYLINIFVCFFRHKKIRGAAELFKFSYLIRLVVQLTDSMGSEDFRNNNNNQKALEDIYSLIFVLISVNLTYHLVTFFKFLQWVHGNSAENNDNTAANDNNNNNNNNNLAIQQQAQLQQQQLAGLSKAQLELIEVREYQSKKLDQGFLQTQRQQDCCDVESIQRPNEKTVPSNDIEECSICCQVCTQGELVVHLHNCAHLFHAHCIKAWLTLHNSCPNCRMRAVSIEAAAALPDK